ncbi:MAG: hypothetical protein AB1644_12260 [Candidatus Zixiibacteriota bacterium]
MAKTALVRLVPLGLIAAMGILGCSSDSNSTGGGGGGGGREFVSGDMGNGQSYQHVFTKSGSFPYYCRYHGGAGGVGMAGTITVSGSGSASLHAFSITNNTLQSTTIDVGDTVRWTNNTVVTHTVESDN